MQTQEAVDLKIFGMHDDETIQQLVRCAMPEQTVAAALMADGHKGYSMPIGGVVAYEDAVSPSGVGYDIGCGVMAVKTDLKYDIVEPKIEDLVRSIAGAVSFGMGRKNKTVVDHALFDSPTWDDIPEIGKMKELAHSQLGTVGSGNHYVDILVEPDTDSVWVATHFGSRGFGHKTATGFLNLAHGIGFNDRPKGEKMDDMPTLLDTNSDVGKMYIAAMELAGQYAYAGRESVIETVLDILCTQALFTVHNHHNFAWKENHNGKDVWVVRKGATPAYPNQYGFIGGSMGDYAVIVRGKDSKDSPSALYSTVHGAGRILSRTQAAGKMNYKTRQRMGGQVTPEMMESALQDFGVILCGGGTDESPFAYRPLAGVIEAQGDTIEVMHTLRPVGVCMAGANEIDPFAD